MKPPVFDSTQSMPHSDNHERAVLGAILLDPSALPVASAILRSEDFHSRLNGRTFAAMQKLAAEAKPIDTIFLLSELSAEGNGTPGEDQIYVSELTKLLPKIDNIEFYAKEIKRAAVQRSGITSMGFYRDAIAAAHDDTTTIQCFDQVTGDIAKLRSELTVEQSGLRTYTPAELAALVPEPVEHIAYPVATKGMLTVLDGLAKAAGKTTLLLHAIRSVLREEIFLGQATRKVNVLLVTEENRRSLLPALERVGLSTETSGLHILTREEWAGIPWTQLTERLQQTCVDLKIGWMALDTFYAIARLVGEDENKSGCVSQAVAPVRDMVGKLDIAATLGRHERKSGGDIGESGRGSSALTGEADVILQLRRMSSNHSQDMRRLEITGRIEQDCLTIELSLGRYIVHEGDVRISTTEDADAVDNAIRANREATIREIAAATGINKNRVAKLAAKSGWTKFQGDPWEIV